MTHSISNHAVLESLRWKRFPLLNDGFITLVDQYGDESSIIRAAKCSYGNDKRVDSDSELPSDEKTLLRYLMRHRHTSVFEMAELVFLVRAPIYVFRQWHRHRTFNYNELSGRYTKMIDAMEVVKPEQWRVQSTTNKQGSGVGVPEWPNDWDRDLYAGTTPAEYLTARQQDMHRHATEIYQERLAFGVAKEQARCELPVSNYSECYCKVDMNNLMHFMGLRSDKHAQLEIRVYSDTILHQIVKPLFPTLYRAFIDYRLEALTLTRLDQIVLQEITLPSYSESPRNQLLFDTVVNNLVHWVGTLPVEWLPDKKCRERDECRDKLSRLLGFSE